MGFYYDDQLSNLDMTIRLYSNTKASSDDNGNLTFEEIPGRQYTNELARAIFNEDFQVEVNNNWSNFDGGNFLESLWGTAKQFGAIINDIDLQIGDLSVDENDNSLTGSIMNKIAKAKDYVHQYKGYLGKALIVQGTRFMYYSGTDIGINNMVLRYTVFYDPVNNLTVHDQIDKLRPYVIGKYTTFSNDEGTKDSPGLGKTVVEGIGTYVGKDSANKLGNMIGWQDPPGGFESSVRSVEAELKGTLKLELGTKYAISNLVIKGMSISYSRHTVKPIPKSNSVITASPTPLYADVILQLQPVGIITESMLSNYVKGLDMNEETLKWIKKNDNPENNTELKP